MKNYLKTNGVRVAIIVAAVVLLIGLGFMIAVFLITYIPSLSLMFL